MARPPKKPEDRMTEVLRIPLTPKQKHAITAAAFLNPSGTAAWARTVLLEAAKKTWRKPEPSG